MRPTSEPAISEPTYNEHSKLFFELWDMSRFAHRYVDDMGVVARRCKELTLAGVPCARSDVPDYAIVKYVAAQWSVEHSDVLADLFSFYVQHGVIALDALMTGKTDVPSSNYGWLHGQRPLVPAVLNGNIHTVQQLLLHGADAAQVEGVDFFEWALQNYGRESFAGVRGSRAQEAVAVMNEAYMQGRIRASVGATPSPALGGKRLRLV